jgi:ABC-type multidrug transport system ATPase subunit
MSTSNPGNSGKMCVHIAIIQKGQIIAQGRLRNCTAWPNPPKTNLEDIFRELTAGVVMKDVINF